MIPELTPNEHIEEMVRDHTFVILQFGTETCQPCHAISHRLHQWGEAHPAVVIRYVPLEAYPEQTAQMGIYSAPTIFTYIEGQLFQRESGYFSVDQLLEKYDRMMEMVEEDAEHENH